ncbi:YCII-related domain-containing protein [Dyadobacter sp. SG02]|uniref:YciI family protein n=1 Tax=Dyadobacter sp. SG02 TaxID=1855291 RepID=UPI0008C1DD0C|nr:YciI family protein [Dyadobacter sp. SG02]SEJ59888.1 YCII-related domain-containing protein [Dyadobacter sp. SG02]
MNEFLLVIHRDLTSNDARPSPDEMKMAVKPYQDWIAGIAARNKLVGPPRRWDADGRFIQRGNPVASGPYTAGKTSIAGLFLIRANDYEEAVEIAGACPIIQYGAVVEVRMAMMPAQ